MKPKSSTYRMTQADKIWLYKDITVKSEIYCKRYLPLLIEPLDIANEIFCQFIIKKKYLKYNAKRGASFHTWSATVAGNLLKDYMKRHSKQKDDTKRGIADTMNEKNQHYFNDLAKQYAVDDTPDED